MPKSRKRRAAVSKQGTLTRSEIEERLAAWLAPDGAVLPPPRLWFPAGGSPGIRSQPCPQCHARPGSPCLNATAGETAEHIERVTLALRAAGRHDVVSMCGRRLDGWQCPEPPLPDGLYCPAHTVSQPAPG